MNSKEGRKFAIGAILAGFVGYIAGVITAPKSGKETRQDIKDVASRTKLEIEKDLKNTHSELKSALKQAQELMKTESKEIKKELSVVIDRAKKSEVKLKETISAIRDGAAEDPELDSALKEAKVSLGHFKKFLKND